MLTRIALEGIVGSSSVVINPTDRTVILGDNGSGKTHILSSIHLAAGGDIVFPSSRENDCITHFEYAIDDRVYDFRYTRTEGKRSWYLQQKKITGVQYLESLPFRTVIFSPFDMNLLYFSPGPRRDMIDSILKRTFSQFSLVKRSYDEILKQRNALLKQIREGSMSPKDLDFWDKKFAEISYTYMLYRKKWVTYVESRNQDISTAFGEYDIEHRYFSHISFESEESDIEQMLFDHRQKDIIVGHTTIGPHLDDFGFMIISDGVEYEAAHFLSRGENKVLLSILKYFEVSFIETFTKKEIVLLFDDLFAELDERHILEVLERFDEYMIIFTTQRLIERLEKREDFTCINLNHP